MTKRPGAYWPGPWTCEDGGPLRRCAPYGEGGLGIGPGESLRVAAVRDAFATDMLIRREPGELYALRHEFPRGNPLRRQVDAWVEQLDPETLAVTRSSPRLPGGRYWPGGIAAHANGDLHMVFGNWAHRFNTGLEVLASHRLPVDRPHNSFVVLDGGELVTKDCDAPAGLAPSTVSVLDPETLLPVAPALELPEPCIARLSSDGESVVVVGSFTVYRLRLDRDAGRLLLDESWSPSYGPAPGRSYGWDPVITDEHVFWMDNGRNHTDRTMLGSGESPDPVRLWWARRDDDEARSVEISGLPHGTESNPPGWDPEGGIVVGYDAGNAVLRAWRLAGDQLEPLWRRDGFAHAGHLILFPDTRELVVQDWQDRAPVLRHPRLRGPLQPLLQQIGTSAAVRRASLRSGSDQLVVLDIDSGEDRARVGIPSPSQAFLFPAPGFGRDLYYQSLTTIARVVVEEFWVSPESTQALGAEVEAGAAPRSGARPGLNWLFERQGYQYVTLGVDAVLLAVALVLADSINPDSSYLPVLVISPLAVILMASRRLYDPQAQISRLDLIAAVVGCTAVAALLVGGLVELTHPSATDSGLIAIQLGFATALLVGWRLLWSTLRRRARRLRRCGRLTLIVGAGEVGGRIEARLRQLSDIGLIPVGFVDASPVSAEELGRRQTPVLGSPSEFSAIVEETGADHAILAFQLEPDVMLRRIVRQCQERDVSMSVVPRLFDDVTNRISLEHVGGMSLFEFRQVDPRGWQFALKHGLDRVSAAILLILISPILAAVAIAVRLSSPGPILFRQRRVGMDGREFDVLKFRSMRPDPEGDLVPELEGDSAPGGIEGEDRRTGVGRFIRAWSLDELPQFINVLRGEMSMIGPRPERPELAGEFAERIRRYDERLRVRSGITGWAQVNGLGPGTSLEERAEWDNWYIQNWSFWLDFKILLMTIPAVLHRSE